MKADIYHELEMLSALTASNDAHIRCAQRSPLFGRGEASKPEPCLVAIVFQYAFVDLAVSETCCLAAGASITDDYFVDRAEKLGLKAWHSALLAGSSCVCPGLLQIANTNMQVAVAGG